MYNCAAGFRYVFLYQVLKVYYMSSGYDGFLYSLVEKMDKSICVLILVKNVVVLFVTKHSLFSATRQRGTYM